MQFNALLFLHYRFGSIFLLNPLDFTEVVLTARKVVLLQIMPLHNAVPTLPQVNQVILDVLHQGADLKHLRVDVFAVFSTVEQLFGGELPHDEFEVRLVAVFGGAGLGAVVVWQLEVHRREEDHLGVLLYDAVALNE